jgi:hypothetical protein
MFLRLDIAAGGFAIVSPPGVEGIGPDGENGRITGMSLSLEPGCRLWPSDDVGLEWGAIGLSGLKKLDFRRSLAGEAGIWARLSIVRSDSDGRECLCNLGGIGSSPEEKALWSSPWWKVCREELLDAVRKLSSEANSSSAVLLPLEPEVWRDLICVVRASGRPTGFLKTASWLRDVDAVRAFELLDSVELEARGGRGRA